MTRLTRQYNFDGIPGPTHQYSGLAHNNPHARTNAGVPSSPRGAALQGLRKAQTLSDLGVPQALLPPLGRPYLQLLSRTGLIGPDEVSPCTVDECLRLGRQMERIAEHDPELTAACLSASAMWTANWATVAPSSDSLDGRCHMTVANLASNLHRAIESGDIHSVLARIFGDAGRFAIHEALPANVAVTDEGAANHMRLCADHGRPGLHLMVFGVPGLRPDPKASTYLGRQTRLASRQVATANALPGARWRLLQQTEAALRAGVFHNDVIAMSNLDLLICHEDAFVEQPRRKAEIAEWAAGSGIALRWIDIPNEVIGLAEAVDTYVFNSQIVRSAADQTLLVCASRCKDRPGVERMISALKADSAIDDVLYVDMEESLRNGGGPACVRLRVELSEGEQASVEAYPGFEPTRSTWDDLRKIVETEYPERWSVDRTPSGLLIRQCLEATRAMRDRLGFS